MILHSLHNVLASFYEYSARGFELPIPPGWKIISRLLVVVIRVFRLLLLLLLCPSRGRAMLRWRTHGWRIWNKLRDVEFMPKCVSVRDGTTNEHNEPAGNGSGFRILSFLSRRSVTKPCSIWPGLETTENIFFVTYLDDHLNNTEWYGNTAKFWPYGLSSTRCYPKYIGLVPSYIPQLW
jgi:hypothetical protein